MHCRPNISGSDGDIVVVEYVSFFFSLLAVLVGGVSRLDELCEE